MFLLVHTFPHKIISLSLIIFLLPSQKNYNKENSLIKNNKENSLSLSLTHIELETIFFNAG